MNDYRQPRRRRRDRAMALIALLGLTLLGAVPAHAATPAVYGDFSMSFVKAWGTFNGGASEWATSPQSATVSDIYWGATWNIPSNPNAPEYHERFERSGDWLTLTGWFDNGAFYRVTIEQEWQAAADCRTHRTALPAGGPQHYVRWTIPAAAYCLYAAGTITEEIAGVPGKHFRFQHEQVWAPPVYDKITQWESWSDDRSGAMTLGLERTQWLGRGKGPAQRIEQTFPSAWTATVTATGRQS